MYLLESKPLFPRRDEKNDGSDSIGGGSVDVKIDSAGFEGPGVGALTGAPTGAIFSLQCRGLGSGLLAMLTASLGGFRHVGAHIDVS